jgi:predicted phage replisome organizer
MGDAKRYYWLKLQEDFFGSKRIKKLRKIAGGDTYTIIYLKMQLLAMRSGGVLEYTGLEQTFAEELALDLDEEPENVTVTVNYLLSCGLLETSDNREFFVPYAVLNTGSETASAKRVRDYRDRKALQCNTDVADVKQLGNGEKEKEKEKEKEIEIEKEKRVNYQRIADMYNETCVSFPRLKSLSDHRKKAIRARMNTYTEEDFKLLFEKAESSDFLKGKNERNWTATFDWLIKDANMAKVLEGNFDKKGAPKQTAGRKEAVPDWMAKHLDKVKQEKTVDNDPALKARAEALKRRVSDV